MASHWPSAEEMLPFTQGYPLDAKADQTFNHLYRCVTVPPKDAKPESLIDLQVADADIVWGFLLVYSKFRLEKKTQVHTCIEILARSELWRDMFKKNENLTRQAGELPEDLQHVLNIEHKLPQAESRRQTRRRIYFHRLIGDDVLKAKMKTSTRASPQSILFFVFYLIIANVVVVNRCDVGTLAEMHRSLNNIIEGSWFTLIPEPKYFADIKTRDDIVLWMSAIGFRITLDAEEDTNLPLTANTYNRIVPEFPACINQSSWRISVRRMALTSNYERTTTERFRQFYPEVWEAATISAGDKLPAAEDTTPYPLTANVEWNHTEAEAASDVLSGKSYEGAGGYVGIWTLSPGGIFFHLVDPAFVIVNQPNTSMGICGAGFISRTLGEEQGSVVLLDRQTASLTLEFMVYNANYQTLSTVAVSFGLDATGTLITRDVNTRTIFLDVFSPTLLYWEIAYILGTSFYFFHFIYSAVKYYDRYLNDIWCFINLASILCSIISFTIWNIYQPRLQEFIQAENDFRKPDSINSLESLFSLYRRVSAIALLSIWLRSLQLLARLRARVRLLLQTLSMGAGKIAAYMFYICVFFSGFVAYAQSSFAYKTANFQTIPLTILTCVEMFFGKVEDNRDRGIRYSLWVVSFMIAFYIFSVQMFNAIINYSYNRVSEDMEPQFEKERNEQTRRELLRQAAGNASRLTQLQKSLGAWLWKPGEKSGVSDGDARAAKKKKEQAVIAPSAFETLDASIKEKVQGYLNRRKNRQVQYGPCAILLFVVFAGVYMLFLFYNISIEDNYRLQHAIDSAVRRAPVPVLIGQNESLSLHWDNISSIDDTKRWFSSALVQVIFNTTTADGQACIKGWNCLVKLKEDGSKNDKIVRITQRRRKEGINDGRRYDNTPDEFAFTGGSSAPGLFYSTELVATRVLEEFDLDFEFNVSFDGEQLCKVEQTGSTLGAGGKDNRGGIVCLLDNDYATFERQVQEMLTANFFTRRSGEIFVEFTTYNGKQNMLSYVTLQFRSVLSGLVEPTMMVRSVQLFTTNGELDLSTVAQRVLTCVAYMILCIILVYTMIKDLINEQERRKLQEDESKLSTAIEFFTHDLFRTLEALSIFISVANAVLFVVWIVEDSKLTTYYPDSNFTVFVQYVQDLTDRGFIFKQVAAFNMLLIFVQPLRFLRTNSRISKLNQTLWDASVDIFWFVVMLLILVTAFVMFAMLSFGPKYYDCRNFWDAAFICFKYIIGAFDYTPLHQADPVMAVLFFFPYLVLCYIIFNNIFFAIIDRFFITAEDKPWNWKRKFKPFLGRICRCVEWDEDHTLEQDPSKDRMQVAVLSRRDRVHDTVQRVEKLKETGKDDATSLRPKRSKTLSDVCEVDSKMAEVLAWSKEEARKFMMLFEKYTKRKAEEKKSEENFVREVMDDLDKEVKDLESEMKDAERHMRYHRDVHEQMALKDQETLARYILVLERKIQQVMDSNQKLRTKVEHLRQQSGAMQDLEPESPDEEDPLGHSHPAPPSDERGQLRDDHSQTPSPGPPRVDDNASSTDSSNDSGPSRPTRGSNTSGRGGPPSRLGLGPRPLSSLAAGGGGPSVANANNPGPRASARSAASASLQGQLK